MFPNLGKNRLGFSNVWKLLLVVAAAHAETIQLMPSDAVISDAGHAQPDMVLVRGATGGRITWRFKTDVAVKKQLQMTYSAPVQTALKVEIPGAVSNTSVHVRSTEGWNDVRTAKLIDLDLPPGEYELQFQTRPFSLVNIHHLDITAEPLPPFTDEYPAIYSKQADWAGTLVAMRAAFRDPAGQRAQPNTGEVLDFYLNMQDGKALWTDFPHQTDWFLQDNQVHGEWGRGYYDARRDYQHYLDSDRDNTLEQKLVATVLEEIDAPEIENQLRTLTDNNCSPDDPAWLQLYEKACRLRRQQRLAPLLEKTKQIVYATHMNMGTIYLATETQGCSPGSQLRLIDLSPEAEGHLLKDDLLFDSHNGIVRDPELSFDGKKLLFAWRKTNAHLSTIATLAPKTGNYKIYEMDLATRKIRPLTTDETYGADFEPCYLPDGNIIFSSARCVHEVTCGWGGCSNLYIMDGDGKYARRVGFDQTQTAFPHLLNDGRVIYTRRDYNDRGQSYGHALFVMNPDGTGQTEYYGNNSMAPTSIQHTRPIPGTGKTMGVAGGYHTTQGGKLVMVDPKRGTQNYDGITFRKWVPTPLDQVSNENYCRVGEQYSYPYPLDEENFLVSFSPLGAWLTSSTGVLNQGKEHQRMRYHLYYMNWSGGRELLATHPVLSCTQAVAIHSRKRPQVRASAVDYTKTNGICYVQNVYYGPSAEGIEPGTIKKLRVVQLHYKPVTIGGAIWGPPWNQVGPGRKYAGYGMHSVLPAGVGSASFDTKTILGEVDVHADGSAMFEVPARTPIYFQLVDGNGLVAQTMRSWATLMPNERFSCVGCHEENDSAPLPQAHKTMAMQQPPQKLKPVHAISGASFSYTKMVQPVLNKHCISCHAPSKKAESIDLTDTLVSDDPNDRSTNTTRREYVQSYLTLLQVKRVGARLDEGRPNQWVDYYTRLITTELTPPYYAGSSRSGIIKMLQEGHGETNLTADEIGTIAAWIDLNVPFVGEYDEMNIWNEEDKELYRSKMEMRRKQESIEFENIHQLIQNPESVR